jgi:hypothetical protein
MMCLRLPINFLLYKYACQYLIAGAKPEAPQLEAGATVALHARNTHRGDSTSDAQKALSVGVTATDAADQVKVW